MRKQRHRYISVTRVTQLWPRKAGDPPQSTPPSCAHTKDHLRLVRRHVPPCPSLARASAQHSVWPADPAARTAPSVAYGFATPSRAKHSGPAATKRDGLFRRVQSRRRTDLEGTTWGLAFFPRTSFVKAPPSASPAHKPGRLIWPSLDPLLARHPTSHTSQPLATPQPLAARSPTFPTNIFPSLSVYP